MNYEKIYYDLVFKRKLNPPKEIYERHHILPKSLGGSNEVYNLVKLTPREHFIAHRLLVKFLKGKDKRKMVFALRCMGWRNNNRNFMTSWRYETIRKELSKIMKNREVFKETRKKLSEINKNRKHSEKTKKKISEKRKEWIENNPEKWSEHCKNASKSHKEEVKKKISEKLKVKMKNNKSNQKFYEKLIKMDDETFRKIFLENDKYSDKYKKYVSKLRENLINKFINNQSSTTI